LWIQLSRQCGLELGTLFVLCGNSALHTHIPSIALFSHQGHCMSFLQIKSSMGLHEMIRQVKHKIYQKQERNCTHLTGGHSWGRKPLQPAAGLQPRSRNLKSGAVAYVKRYNPVEVVPRVSPNCTEEIPITWNNTSL
jgi:hypothetical protein